MPSPGSKQQGERSRDKLSLLRSHPLFRDLPPGVIEHLGSYMKTRRVARGTSIFAKGDPGTGLMGVLAGAVKVSVASADGKDIVLNVFREGDIFGEIALLDGLNSKLEGRTSLQKNPNPKASLRWAAWIIAKLGGWDGYPSSKPPGPITFKNGLQQFHAMVAGWSLKDVCMP